MSKRHVRLGFVMVLLLVVGAASYLLRGTCRGLPSFVPVAGGTALLGSREPGGWPIHERVLPALSIGTKEITAGQFAEYLNASASHGLDRHPALQRVDGRWRADHGCLPVSHVSLADAEGYCRWLAERMGRPVRLPDEDEWEAAARGGIRGAPFPWGWEAPEGRAQFAASGVRAVGSYPANGAGLYDMAGNLAEWCRAPAGEKRAIARGGSFADRDGRRLAVWSRTEFPRDYRDADVGFRVVMGP